MIRLDHVSKYFGNKKAVADISFEVAAGENLILLGTSGSGKTTTLRMINRLIEPDEGRIEVNGENIYTQSPEKLRRGIGYVLQQNGLFPHYTVAENIAIVPQLLQWDKQKIYTRTRELMEKLHLSPDQYMSVYPEQLSGGQQQRVGLARALAADPPVLLMDEPFGALDPVTRASIRKELSELDEFKRKTMVMVTHDVIEAFELGDRICLMNEGRIMQIGKPAELLFHPANDFVQAFLIQHYTQLALKTVTVQDTWGLFTHTDSAAPASDVVTSDTSLWHILEYVTKDATNETLSISNQKGEIKQVWASDIIRVFNQYKSN